MSISLLNAKRLKKFGDIYKKPFAILDTTFLQKNINMYVFAAKDEINATLTSKKSIKLTRPVSNFFKTNAESPFAIENFFYFILNWQNS